MNSDDLRVGRERLLRVFQFLEALNQHRNPPKRQIREQLWTLWLKGLPDHPAIQRGSPRVEDGRPETSGAPDAREDEDFILKVSRPKLTRPPEPPAAIKTWLEAGWDDPSKDLTVRKTRNEQNSEGETVVVRFEDDPGRASVLETWRGKRDLWAEIEKPARAASRVFENLYELYGRTEREAERVELVLGDGILRWRRPEGGVHHPVLLQGLQISFEPSIPEFRLTETEHPVELYSAMFQSMPDVDGRSIGRCREELERGNYHPLGDRDTVGFLKRLVVQLSPRGEFVEGGAADGETDDPRIGRSPVIFLRARTLGFAAAIEAIIEDLRNREDLPWSLLNIVGLEPPIAADQDKSEPPTTTDTAPDVLLSKPANPEQIRIAQCTTATGATLVQGPPGTGKTHTIGNLIGHLLAQGKSVLVTSHTTKALRMVRSQVESKLRPLCVSVLESDLDSRKQLEGAVGEISARLSQADSKSLETEADLLSKQRADLQETLARLRERLANARADEYRDLVVNGQSWAPSEAARWIAREEDRCSWIPAPVALGAGLPLSEGEMTELYSTNHSIPADAERELAASLSDAAELPSPAEFEALTRTRTQLSGSDRNLQSELWQPATSKPAPESVSALAAKVEAAIDVMAGGDRWKLAAVYAGKNGGPHREPWDNLVTLIEQVHLEAAKSQEILLRLAPTLDPESSLEEQEKTALEIQAHLRQDGSLGFVTLLTHKSWKHLTRNATVNGDRPTLPEHFGAISRLCRVKALRRDLGARWDRQMASLGAAGSKGLGDEIEKTAVQYCAPIRTCLSWSSRTWTSVERELREAGFNWDKFLSEQPPSIGADGELRRLQRAVTTALLPILAARTNALLWERNLAALGGLRELLSLAKKVAADSIVLAELYDAVSDCNPESYRTGYARLLELGSLRNELGRRRQLLARLEAVAPGWASAIRGRRGVHGASVQPGDFRDAWTWRQLYDELEARASVSIEEIQSSIDRAGDDLRTITIELIDRRAWASQAKRTSLSQRQALIGWLDTIRKIGKGTGIRVPRLRAEAARKMTECRAAVPVWVMPLARVVDNFDPRTSRFDVVIIDEASQSDVMALVALYLGASVVVVGDHEQVSPSAVGQEIAVVQNLIDQFLDGIPNSHLYDGKTSVYDLARQSFGGTIRLVEHFRCVTEVIQFSNELSYGDIKPLRDASKIVLKPHTIAYRVEGSSRDGKVNRQEAEVIASLAAAALEQTEYKKNEFGKSTSFGVVSLVGEEQALEIDRLLRLHVPPDVYERHRFLCGTSAQFQGDERDVVFLSVVDTPTGSPLRFRDDQMFKQRYNVAASRARDQMWVVHSLNVQTDLRSGDLRRRLIEHALDPSALMRLLEDKEKRTESPFEREVLRKLLAAGYHVTPQWKVGARRIDLVVEGAGRRLAVECDGDRYHPLEKLAEDMDRQAVLERLGWIFARIRGSVFFRDPDRAMKPVFEKLRDLEIEPWSEPSEKATHEGAGELVERVTRRAEQLRSEWNPKEPLNGGAEASPTTLENSA
jgi:very-short-patch-repair endonuclease